MCDHLLSLLRLSILTVSLNKLICHSGLMADELLSDDVSLLLFAFVFLAWL